MHTLNGPAESVDAEGFALELQQVSRSFDRGRVPAVIEASLQIRYRETFALVGESGSGKSTLARLAAGLITPDHGRVTILGHELSTLKKSGLRRLRRHVQFIFQDPYSSLDPRQRIGSALEEPLKVHGEKNAAERKSRVERMLAKVGLAADVVNKFPHQFSGGQRQRLAIARALIVEPTLLICDEPVSALDVSVQAQVLNLLRQLREEMRLSMLFISHDLAVVAHMADRVGVMHRGSIVEVGAAHDLFAAPQHPYTQSLLAAVPRLRRQQHETIIGDRQHQKF
jgi:ABC-type glutathione transport system ATPase component